MTDSDLQTLLDNLEACKASLHSRLHCWTWLVVIGVALEFVSLLWEFIRERNDFKRAEIHAPEKPNLGLYVIGFLGIALVVAGVSGELYIDGQLGAVETSIRKANEDRFALLKARAEDVSKEADVIQKRLDTASQELSGIEDQVRIQGPRWKLLEAHRDDFVRALKQFPKQHVKVMQCGGAAQVPAAEVEKLEQDLIDMLGEKGAGWLPEFVLWPRCTNGASDVGGNLVVVSVAAGDSVKDAANTLWRELNSIEITTIRTQSNGGFPLLGEGDPWAVAAKDPSAVVLLVGANPGFVLSEQKKRRKADHK